MKIIENGTIFSALVNYENNFSINEYILLDEYDETENICILKESPFGQTVLGKKIGESFSYQIEDQIITGIIQDIIIKQKTK